MNGGGLGYSPLLSGALRRFRGKCEIPVDTDVKRIKKMVTSVSAMPDLSGKQELIGKLTKYKYSLKTNIEKYNKEFEAYLAEKNNK